MADEELARIRAMYEKGFLSREEYLSRTARWRIHPPCPAHIRRPKRRFLSPLTMARGEGAELPFPCADDGGLSAAETPEGRVFSLTDAEGIPVRFRVESVLRRAGGTEYAGAGRIGHYTAAEDQPLTVFRPDAGELWFLRYRYSEANRRAERESPLWREYFRWLDSLPPMEEWPLRE